jgi:LacI family transcriptional regulator
MRCAFSAPATAVTGSIPAFLESFQSNPAEEYTAAEGTVKRAREGRSRVTRTLTRTSIRDVAAHAGVSVGTASNVLNRPHTVAAQTRARVQAAIAALDFVPNDSARALRSMSTRTIGLIVLDISNPFFTDVARGVEEAATAEGLAVFLCNSDQSVERERRYLDLLEERRVQGVLITPVNGISARLRSLRRRGTSVVLLDRMAHSRNFCSVSVDDVAGGQLAAAHLVAQGHRRIALVGGSPAIQQVEDRRAGARAALREAGLPEAALLLVETQQLNVAAGRAAGARVAEMPASRRPTAAFCVNDMLALGFLQEMTRRRIAVPGEMAIAGYDDIDFAAAAAVPLSSVRQPREELGRAAARLLAEEAQGGSRHAHRQLVFEPEMVVRESSQAAAQRRRARAR